MHRIWLLLLSGAFAATSSAIIDDHIARWSFDDGVGTTLAGEGPAGFDGSVSGATWVPGVDGTALEFDNLNDFVEISDGDGPPDAIGALPDGSISVWFRFDAAPPTNTVEPILYLGDGVSGAGHSSLIIEIGHFGTRTDLFFTIMDDDHHITQCYDSGFNVTPGDWHHFVAVVEPGFNTGYLDGAELTGRDYNVGTNQFLDEFFADVIDQQVLWLGRGFFSQITTEQWLGGAIDELRIYDRALTAADVTELFQLGGGTDGLSVTIDSPVNGDVISGMTTITGTSEAAAGVRVSIDDGPFVPAQGVDNWSFTFDASVLSESDHVITVRAGTGPGSTVETSSFVIVNDESPPTPDCGSIVPGTPLPYSNTAAPGQLVYPAGSTIHLEIIGHSENAGYHTPLQQLLDADPPGGYTYVVTNNYIGGHETWRWTTPGEAGYQVVEDIINNIQGPTIALVLTSNNTTFPAGSSDLGDTNYALFVEQTEQLADHLYNAGGGVDMCYFSAHRMKPQNLMPCWYENLAIGDLMSNVEAAGKAYVKPGPEQHQLHWCCYPDCYAADFSHPNVEGGELMAEAWHNLLSDQIGGCAADLAPPFGVLDLADVGAFVAAFVNQQPAADLNGDGVYDLADLQAFIDAFVSGCAL